MAAKPNSKNLILVKKSELAALKQQARDLASENTDLKKKIELLEKAELNVMLGNESKVYLTGHGIDGDVCPTC